jgi:hypothetical protein
MSQIITKRRKHKEKLRPPEKVLCKECDVTDVTNGDPELEYICEPCWAKIYKALRAKDKAERKS